jgi:hypothetical protein
MVLTSLTSAHLKVLANRGKAIRLHRSKGGYANCGSKVVCFGIHSSSVFDGGNRQLHIKLVPRLTVLVDQHLSKLHLQIKVLKTFRIHILDISRCVLYS